MANTLNIRLAYHILWVGEGDEERKAVKHLNRAWDTMSCCFLYNEPVYSAATLNLRV
jgi:hypothetical protein